MRAAAAGIAAFAVAYLLSGTLQLPALAYDPLARSVFVARAVTGVTMRYPGDLLTASLAGVAAAAIAIRLPPRTPAAIAAATALSLVALDAFFYLSRLLASL
jgi:hypothetical protein